ncbi:MAG: DUF853 family protein [Clostridiales bacterium]|nr:DUF853 family protein [Clostridiales bacterium]
MYTEGKILVGKGENPVFLHPKMANRHGLIAGATGTGKTITLKVLAESFSEMGVPVFLADIKGDLSGMCKAGATNESLEKRLGKMGITDFDYHAFPTRFWDVYGKAGHPVRTTVSEMGPVLLSRLLELTEVQEGVLNIVFRIADDKQLLLVDLKDLRAMLNYVGEHNTEFTTEYGNVSRQSVGAILRALLALEDAGGQSFFGEPELDIFDWMTTDEKGRGHINVLHCVELFQQPILYSTFLLWLLTELFENLPELGDAEKPKMVFFFDEAHLLFNEAPKALVKKVEQVVKLIRSKGVGVYFITQSPSDIPDAVLAQLGNRVQHALRAYTPAEQKAVRTAAQSFRVNPNFDTEQVITELGTGEALISCLDEEGRPSVVEQAKVLPPQSQMGPVDEERRKLVIESSDVYGKYEKAVDAETAYEILTAAAEKEEEQKKKEAEEAALLKEQEAARKEKERQQRAAASRSTSRSSSSTRRSSSRKSPMEKMANQMLNTIGRELGKSVTRGILGMLKR